jgi:uncharacterized protein YkwD
MRFIRLPYSMPLAPAARALGLAAVAVLAGCADSGRAPSAEPSFYHSMNAAGATVDAATAASMISGYRRNNGLGAVRLNSTLTRMAAEQSRAMAARDKLDHNLVRALPQRLARAGYDAKIAVENIGAGYHTLAEAFSGWRDSPQHRANMLRSGVTEMGIAVAYTARSKYKVYWTLIMAVPDDAPKRGSRGAGANKPKEFFAIGGAPVPR